MIVKPSNNKKVRLRVSTSEFRRKKNMFDYISKVLPLLCFIYWMLVGNVFDQHYTSEWKCVNISNTGALNTTLDRLQIYIMILQMASIHIKIIHLFRLPQCSVYFSTLFCCFFLIGTLNVIICLRLIFFFFVVFPFAWFYSMSRLHFFRQSCVWHALLLFLFIRFSKSSRTENMNGESHRRVCDLNWTDWQENMIQLPNKCYILAKFFVLSDKVRW